MMPVIHEDRFTHVYGDSSGDTEISLKHTAELITVVSTVLGPIFTFALVVVFLAKTFAPLAVVALLIVLGWGALAYINYKVYKAKQAATVYKVQKQITRGL